MTFPGVNRSACPAFLAASVGGLPPRASESDAIGRGSHSTTPERENGGMHVIDIISNWCRGDTTRGTRQKKGAYTIHAGCENGVAHLLRRRQRQRGVTPFPLVTGLVYCPGRIAKNDMYSVSTRFGCPPVCVPASPRACLSPRSLFPSFFIPPLPLLSPQVPLMLGQMPKWCVCLRLTTHLDTNFSALPAHRRLKT